MAIRTRFSTLGAAVFAIGSLLALADAHAVPAFNRQTGQNCVACHAGGNFPDLTPYGRMFKLTGYTIGERAIPVSVMGVASLNKTRDTSDPYGQKNVDFPKDGDLIFSTGSLFLAGKILDNVGAFVQITYNNYDTQGDDGQWHGHTASDNMDFRYADRFIGDGRDLIFGVTFNNNPQLQDPWNSVVAWGYNTVPGSSGPAAGPLVGGGLAQSVAGLGAYVFYNRSLYAEFSMYRNASGAFSFMSFGHTADRGDLVKIAGTNPYFRLAWSHEWGPNSGMIGLYGLNARVYPDATNPDGPTTRYKDLGVDGQYQYLLDPHTVTVTASYTRERINYPDTVAGQSSAFVDAQGNPLPLSNGSDTLNSFRAKATYVYRAQYGTSLQFFNVTGSSNTLNQTSGYDPATLTIAPPTDPDAEAPSLPITGNLAGSPGTRGWTGELFWLPWQNLRVGVQWTGFNRFNGVGNNFDGFGRSAKDNNTTFLYLWAAL